MPTAVDVRFNELDPYGHVNHTVYLTYLEVARVDLLAAHGVELIDLATRTGAQLVVVGVEVDYLAPAVAGDRLTVTCEVAERRRASVRFHQTVRRGDRELVRARVRAAVLDADGRPRALPEALLAALEPVGGGVAGGTVGGSAGGASADIARPSATSAATT